MPAELIGYSEFMRQGTDKINAAITILNFLEAAIANGVTPGNGTVTRSKLSPTFSLNGNLVANANLNGVLTEGLHFGQSNGGYSNLPPLFDSTRSFLLRVEPLSTRFFIQTIIDFTDQKNVWTRRVDNQTNTGTTWAASRLADGEVTTIKVANGAVNRGKIADNFLYNTALSSGDANTLLKDGEWLLTDQLANMPEGASAQGYFSVKNYNNSSFILQEYTELVNYKKRYRRTIRPASNVFNPWEIVSVPEGANAFQGKKMVFFYDSFGEFENGAFASQLASKLGITVYNVAIGGTRIGKHENNSQGVFYNEMSMYRLANYVNSGDFTELVSAAEQLYLLNGDDNRPQVALLESIDFTEIDYVMIGQATNDFAATTPIPIGSNTDVLADGSTFKGAYNYAIQQLQNAYPHLLLVLVTPVFRSRYIFGDTNNSDDFANPSGVYLRDFAQAVKDIGKIHHLPVLNLHDKSGINKMTSSHYVSSDGLHPSLAGFELLASKAASFMKAEFS